MEQITERDAQLLEFIPEEIMFEILTRLPVRSLLKFRCVCKSWNSLISSPNFINAHLENHTMDSDYILVKSLLGKKSLYSAKDFTKYMNLDLRSFDMNLDCNPFLVYGSCNGLLCILVIGSSSLFIWNPSIRKIKRLPQGLYQDADIEFRHIGFGYNHQKDDYQVVDIIDHKEDMYKVKVYSLRLDSWRELSAISPVSLPFSDLDHCSMDANGVVYWIFTRSRRFILSFDMNNEVFQKIEFPDILLHRGFHSTISFQEFKKSPSMIHLLIAYDHDCREDDDNRVRGDSHCDIWILGLNNTWKKTRTILLPQVKHYSSKYRPAKYRRAGRKLSLTKDALYIARMDLEEYSLKSRGMVYDHISRIAKEITTVVEVCPRPSPVDVLTYKESLVLLN